MKNDNPQKETQFVFNVKNGTVLQHDLRKGSNNYGFDDSIGNDGAHDGQGIGHERGDHTDHYTFVKFNKIYNDGKNEIPSKDSSFEEILFSHTSLTV